MKARVVELSLVFKSYQYATININSSSFNEEIFVTMNMKIPHSPIELSSDWLNRALRYTNTINTGKVSECEYSPVDKSKGFYSQIFRLKLTYDPPGLDAPRTIIAKLSSSNPKMRQRSNTKASYEREVRFYQEIAPENVLPVPLCYYSDIDMKSGWHILLLEDLAPSSSGTRTRGCSPKQARIVIQNIARFHAHWWNNPRLHRLQWLADTKVPSDAQLFTFREQLWPAFLRKIGISLPAEMVRVGEILGKNKGWITRHLFIKKPQTLIHGDFHLENIIFKAKGKDGIFVIDWQLMKRGRGIWDVAYFLSQNLTQEGRKATEMSVLHEYLRILNDLGVQDYSFDNAMYDYRLSLLHRFGSLITTIAAMPFSEEQIKVHIDVLLPRTVSAFLDHDCQRLLDD